MNERREELIPIECMGGKSGNFFDGFAEADAESGKNLADFFIGIRTVSGDNQRGKAVNDQPHVAEIAVGILWGHVIYLHKRWAGHFLRMLHRFDCAVFSVVDRL